MDKTTLNIKLLYDKMGKAEKHIADWIFEHPGEIISLSIIDLAEKCGCGEATIVRFAKRLGFSGFQELKFVLGNQSGKNQVSTNICAEDDAYTIYEKVCNDIYLSLEKTKQSLNKTSLSLAADKICKANKIVIFGLGNSASVATDLSHKLLRAGLNAIAYSDNHMQVIAASHLKEGDVAIGISHSGSSKDIVEALKTAREQGASTISVTNRGKSPILKHSDIVLQTSADETQYSILALNSRIAQLAIVDTLYFYIVYNRSEEAQESIKQTEKSLLTKKY